MMEQNKTELLVLEWLIKTFAQEGIELKDLSVTEREGKYAVSILALADPQRLGGVVTKIENHSQETGKPKVSRANKKEVVEKQVEEKPAEEIFQLPTISVKRPGRGVVFGKQEDRKEPIEIEVQPLTSATDEDVLKQLFN